MLVNRIKFGFVDLSLHDLRVFMGFVTVIVLLFWVWGYFSMSRSSEFLFAEKYIRASKIVEERIGEIRSSRLGFVNFKARHSKNGSMAIFHIVLDGSRQSGVAYFRLRAARGDWQIESATLQTSEGTVIDLSSK